ncbi:hypothetical protein [Akkermansia muciniphila]|uniref:hypothetical protein n=1 Tax=Akkermansia muciniphila TaxID=239935 RepID=UPI001BFEF93C|nr:hypothetical protein [Akkermansia muciniphila]MBT8777621.1 hypothetical protein [Akkermansia muciniphila]
MERPRARHGGTARERLKTERPPIGFMLPEHWNKGKIQRSPQSLPALPGGLRRDAPAPAPGGVAEHGREEKIKGEWIAGMREKTPGAQASGYLRNASQTVAF